MMHEKLKSDHILNYQFCLCCRSTVCSTMVCFSLLYTLFIISLFLRYRLSNDLHAVLCSLLPRVVYLYSDQEFTHWVHWLGSLQSLHLKCSIPMQILWSSSEFWYPLRQEQLKDPTVFTQRWLHPEMPSLHSSISTRGEYPTPLQLRQQYTQCWHSHKILQLVDIDVWPYLHS